METKEELRKRLTPLQYQVTQEAGTERAFTGIFLLKLFFFDENYTINFKYFFSFSIKEFIINIMIKEFINVLYAIRIYLVRIQNMIQDVVGQPLMMC